MNISFSVLSISRLTMLLSCMPFGTLFAVKYSVARRRKLPLRGSQTDSGTSSLTMTFPCEKVNSIVLGRVDYDIYKIHRVHEAY